MKNFHLFLAAALLLFLSACQEEVPETPSGPLPAPQNVHCTDVTSTSLTFAWDVVDGAERYAVRLKNADDGTIMVTEYETSLSHAFTGLETGTSYICMVRAIAGNRFSEFTSSSAYTPGESTPDPEPEPDPDPDPDMTEAYRAMLIPSAEDDHGLTLAFPGAEGGGMYTTGGRGGKVLHVTTLEDTGTEGSLRWAINQSGARTIVFDVAGIIRLKSQLNINNGNLTIAGQTAPGDGICIADNTVRFSDKGVDNVIIRFMRFRLGDEGTGLSDGSDAICGRYGSNIIIDHCSMSWSIDEVASFYANINFTMQWCTVAEALRLSGLHSKDEHGYGGIWGGKDASFHHNLLAHNDSRNARIDHPQIYGSYIDSHRGNVDYRNNVIYNWGSNSTYGGEDGHFNIVGNYYKPGPASSDKKYFVDAYWYYFKDNIVYADSYPELYMNGNYHAGNGVDEINSDNYSGIYYHDQSKTAGKDNPDGNEIHEPLGIKYGDRICYTTTHSAQSAYSAVLKYAGASLVRDAVDERIAGEAETGTATYMKGTTETSFAAGSTSKGGMIDSQSVVGGWPSYSATTENEANDKIDSDSDGIPDWFEDRFGLNSKDSSDAASKTIDIHGRYTNFEMYLHYLVRNIVASQTSGGTYTSLD